MFPPSTLQFQSMVIPIVLMSDEFMENNEEFEAMLTLPDDSIAILDLDTTSITIVDDDGELRHHRTGM